MREPAAVHCCRIDCAVIGNEYDVVYDETYVASAKEIAKSELVKWSFVCALNASLASSSQTIIVALLLSFIYESIGLWMYVQKKTFYCAESERSSFLSG